MPLPRNFELLEMRMAEQREQPQFSIIGYCLQRINADGISMADLATELELNRDTLERWLSDCGYRYQLQKALVPVVPIPVADGAGA